MAMRKNTIVKYQRFLEEVAPVGSLIIGHHFHELNAEKYPCWETLKRNNLVTKVKEELVQWGYSEGEEDGCGSYTEIKWNTYLVNGL